MAGATSKPIETVNLNDRRLIDECLDGHPEAFGALVRRYEDRLYGTVAHLIGSREDARDIVQETFVKAYQALGTFAGNASFYTWVYRIAVNHAISQKRRQRTVLSIDARRDLHGDDPADDPERTQPSRPLEQAERQRQVQDALARLPTDYRTVLVLKDIEDHSYATIAEIVGCPIGTVRSRLHRARVELRDMLRHLVEEDLRA